MKFIYSSLGSVIVCIGLFILTFDTLSAHSTALPGALALPACNSRALACEQPPELQEPDDPYRVPDGHCRDGLGVARFCDQESVFPYLDLIAIESQNGATTFEIIEREAVFDSPCIDGFAGPFPCDNIDLLAFLPLDEIGGGRGSDIWGWTDPETAHEYALMGRNNGTSIVDVTNPITPTYLGDLPTQGTTSPWRDIKTYKDHAYVVADFNLNHGMQVFDLTQLRDAMTPTATISPVISDVAVSGPVVFTPTAHYAEFSRAHNIAINEESGFAYTLGGETCKSGPHVIDIQNPTDPQFAGCYEDDGYTHDAQCVRYRGPDLAYNDREICFNSNVDTLTIMDMTDKENPAMLSRVGSPDFAYFHQSWLTEDQRYLLSDDEVDENRYKHNTRTYIWDVSELHNPRIIGVHTADVEAIDHNLYIRGNTVFEANYMSGLRIFTLDEVAEGKLTEIAYLDTFPEVDILTTGSAWSVYPYFESGTVVVSSIEDGLFVLQPKLAPEFSAIATDNVLDVCIPSLPSPTSTMVFSDSLQLSAYNHYSGTVHLMLDPPQQGLALSDTQVEFARNSSTTLDILADLQTVGSGTHSFQVALTDDESMTTTLPFEFNAQSTSPAAVSFGFASGTVIIPPGGTLSWDPVDDAVDYIVEISTDSMFEEIVHRERTRDARMSPPLGLEEGKDYYWRVQASNVCGEGPFSLVRPLWINHAVFVPVIQ